MSYVGRCSYRPFDNVIVETVSKFGIGRMKNGAAVKSLALGSVCGKRLVLGFLMDQVGARVETAAVAKPCISASRVRESAMTIEKI